MNQMLLRQSYIVEELLIMHFRLNSKQETTPTRLLQVNMFTTSRVMSMFNKMIQKKRYLPFLILFISISLQGQTYSSIVCDKDSRQPIEEAVVIACDSIGRNVGLSLTDSTGHFLLVPRKKTPATLQFSRIGYQSQTWNIKSSLSADTIFMEPSATLKEVRITAQRKLVKLYPDKIVYYAEEDPDAQKGNTFDIMHKVPLLIVSKKGNIQAEGEKKIVYKLNGINDPLLTSGNSTEDILSVLEAKGIKRIEVVTQPGIQYDMNTLVVNIVTKGKIEGYQSAVGSTLYDNMWTSFINGTTKYKNLMLWGCYSNVWRFGHDSRTTIDEYRLNSADNYYLHKVTQGHDFKNKSHSFELSASYDVDDYTLLSISGRTIMSINPHQDTDEAAQIVRNDGSLNYAYSKNNHRLFNNSENSATINLERTYKENGKDWRFYLGYEYYSRPFDETTTENYNYVDSLNMTPGSMDSYFNYNQRQKASFDLHTAKVGYKNTFNKKHELEATADYIYRYQDNDYVLKTAPLSSDQYMINKDGTQRYTQFQNVLIGDISYKYQASKYQLMAGLSNQIQNDRLRHSDSQHNVKQTFYNALPKIMASYVCSNKTSLELFYTMGVLRPDVFALDPYVNTTTPMQLSYGNPDLKPERTHAVQLTTNLNLSKVYMRWGLSHQYTDRIMLEHRFLQGDVLHITKGNLGHKNTTGLSGYLSSRALKGSYFSLSSSLSYISYNAKQLNIKNDGFFFNISGQWQQDLPLDIYLELGGNYHSRYIMLQGKGSEGFGYNAALVRSFLKKKLRISLSGSSFVPIHYTQYTNREAENYKYSQAYRYYHASFELSVRYNFGHLKVKVKETENSISTNDIKRDYDE